jgi:hypothetical protein
VGPKYYPWNRPTRKKRWDLDTFHGIDQQEKKGGTRILSTKLISNREEARPMNMIELIHLRHTLHISNKYFGQFRVQRNDIKQSCQQKVFEIHRAFSSLHP